MEDTEWFGAVFPGLRGNRLAVVLAPLAPLLEQSAREEDLIVRTVWALYLGDENEEPPAPAPLSGTDNDRFTIDWDEPLLLEALPWGPGMEGGTVVVAIGFAPDSPDPGDHQRTRRVRGDQQSGLAERFAPGARRAGHRLRAHRMRRVLRRTPARALDHPVRRSPEPGDRTRPGREFRPSGTRRIARSTRRARQLVQHHDGQDRRRHGASPAGGSA